MDNKQPVPTREIWRQARDAVCLGAALKDVAETYGINFNTLKDKARREQWPRPERLPPPPPPVPAAAVASRSLAQRGEQHRALIADMVERALQQAQAAPPALNNWSDIAVAAKLGNTALGLDAPTQPVVSLTFPASSSIEAPAFLDISTNFPPNARRDPPPEPSTLPLPDERASDQ